MKIKKFAFTLAETLITLTIVGVIAALTIPNLISKYQKHTYYIGLLKAQSVITNALQSAPAEAGCSGGDYECAGLIGYFYGNPYWDETKLLSRLKVVKTIPYSDCFDADYYEVSNGEKKKASMSCQDSYITEDGMLWIGFSSNHTITGTSGFIMQFYVDVNGNKKGPNTLGRDVFKFEIMTDTNFRGIKQGTIMPVGGKLQAESRKMWGDYYWKNNINARCNSSNLSIYCTGRVLEERGMKY